MLIPILFVAFSMTLLGCSEEKKPVADSSSTTPPVSGAGPTLIEDYPKNKGHYFLPTVTTETTETLPSENTTRWYGGKPWNHLAANNLTNRAASDAGRQYVGGSMNDYYLQCLDIWAHPVYSIKLTISDQDTEAGEGVEDEIDDWN